jgi:hypothetical protein
MNDLMKKFNMAELKPVSTSMSMAMSLDPDENGKVGDQQEYRSMISSLLYLTAARADIPFAMCLCARFRLPDALHIGLPFSKSSVISNILLSLGFGILLLPRWTLLVFLMMVVGLIERALLVLVIFLDLLSFAILKNNLHLLNPP